MFENKKSVDCEVIMPAKAFKIESESDFDGFDILCLCGENCDCEYRNGGHCENKGTCNEQQKVGYVKPCSACRMYPKIGEYVVFNIKGEIIIVSEEQAKSNIVFKNGENKK